MDGNPCEKTGVPSSIYVIFKLRKFDHDFLQDFCMNDEGYHAGLHEEFLSSDIMERLNDLIEKYAGSYVMRSQIDPKDPEQDVDGNLKIHLCGWGLGGAMATIAAAHIAGNEYSKNAKMKLITFGSPRCVNQKLANRIERSFQVERFVNISDPVPALDLNRKPIGICACWSCPN